MAVRAMGAAGCGQAAPGDQPHISTQAAQRVEKDMVPGAVHDQYSDFGKYQEVALGRPREPDDDANAKSEVVVRSFAPAMPIVKRPSCQHSR